MWCGEYKKCIHSTKAKRVKRCKHQVLNLLPYCRDRAGRRGRGRGVIQKIILDFIGIEHKVNLLLTVCNKVKSLLRHLSMQAILALRLSRSYFTNGWGGGSRGGERKERQTEAVLIYIDIQERSDEGVGFQEMKGMRSLYKQDK